MTVTDPQHRWLGIGVAAVGLSGLVAFLWQKDEGIDTISTGGSDVSRSKRQKQQNARQLAVISCLMVIIAPLRLVLFPVRDAWTVIGVGLFVCFGLFGLYHSKVLSRQKGG
jgi:hypothetical protein